MRDAGGRVLVYEALGSTQDEALARVRAGERDVVGVRAGYQFAGRGRRGASWVAPPGTCLLVTYILYGDDCRPDDAARLALVAAVAVADMLEAQAGLSPNLKWPNDVLLSGRKTAGILIETTAFPPSADGADVCREGADRRESAPSADRSEWAALVGIGLNVNVERFPPELERTATSLLLETGRAWEIGALEMALRGALFSLREETARRGFGWLLERWRVRDATAGRRFQAVVDDQVVEGIAACVSETGALILRLDSGAMMEVFAATALSAI